MLGILRVDGFGPEDASEVLVAPGRRVRGVDFPWRHDPTPDRAVQRRGAVRLAAPLDALLDAAHPDRFELADRRLRLAFDWLCWRDVLSRSRSLETAERLAGTHPGAARLLEGLGSGAGRRCESEGEREVGGLLLRFTPGPQAQAVVAPGVRVDWFFRTLRFAVEYDGTVDHVGAGPEMADTRRAARLRACGVEVATIVEADLRDEASLVAVLAGRGRERNTRERSVALGGALPFGSAVVRPGSTAGGACRGQRPAVVDRRSGRHRVRWAGWGRCRGRRRGA